MTRTRRSTVALAAATVVLTLAACGSAEAPEVVEGGTEGTIAEEESAQGSSDQAGQETSDDVTQDAASVGDDTTQDAASGSDDTTQDDTGSDTPGDVEAARAGLARYLEANRPETPTTSTNIPGCPVLEVSVLEQRMADAGLADATLEGWGTEIEWNEYEDISPDLMGVACGGDSDGNPNDSDFGTAGGMVALDLSGHTDFSTFLGDLGMTAEGGASGDTLTICPEVGHCTALWHSDGLVVGVTLMADGVDEGMIDSLLEGLLPEALTTLAGN